MKRRKSSPEIRQTDLRMPSEKAETATDATAGALLCPPPSGRDSIATLAVQEAESIETVTSHPGTLPSSTLSALPSRAQTRMAPAIPRATSRGSGARGSGATTTSGLNARPLARRR